MPLYISPPTLSSGVRTGYGLVSRCTAAASGLFGASRYPRSRLCGAHFHPFLSSIFPPSLHPPFALKTGGARVHETARPCRIIDTRPYSTDKIDFLFNFASNCREFEASCVDEDGKEKKEKEKKTRSLRYMTNCFIFNVEDTVDKFITATEYRRVTRKLRTRDPLFYHSCLFYRAID